MRGPCVVGLEKIGRKKLGGQYIKTHCKHLQICQRISTNAKNKIFALNLLLSENFITVTERKLRHPLTSSHNILELLSLVFTKSSSTFLTQTSSTGLITTQSGTVTDATPLLVPVIHVTLASQQSEYLTETTEGREGLFCLMITESLSVSQ